MRARSWITGSKDHPALLVVLGMLILLWQILQAAATFKLDPNSATTRAVSAIRQAAPGIVGPGDVVFVSSQEAGLRHALDELGASVHELDDSNANGAGSPLLGLLDDRCKLDPAQGQAAAYWVWTSEDEQTPAKLGAVARALNFFFTFQAVLPYRGDAAFAIDKLLRLQPKDDTIRRYCEAARLAGDRPVLLILDSGRFSPWIGSVVTRRITWLASSPQRNMTESEFAVQDMPPLLTYDVFWLGQVPLFPLWIFENQDLAAYEGAVQPGKALEALVLVDKKADLGDTALRYLRKCRAEEKTIESSLFQQMCFK